ncbi:MAG: hypothetical protein JWQ28_1815 [Pedobacter sp.]|jgi:hypothetical protein|nr:hypothetical protein [Pedobacter sp.]
MSNPANTNESFENPIPDKKKFLEGEEEFIEDLPANLGLDADRSSDNDSPERKYNMDNDIASDNSKDDSDHLEEPFDSSPIMNK